MLNYRLFTAASLFFRARERKAITKQQQMQQQQQQQQRALFA